MTGESVPESFRARAEELENEPPLRQVRRFLQSSLADADGFEEFRNDLRRTAALSTRSLRRFLRAFDRFMAEPQPDGLLTRLVAGDANWVLDDLSDAAAKAFLYEVARAVAEAADEADSGRGAAR